MQRTTALIAILLISLLAACGGKQAPPTGEPQAGAGEGEPGKGEVTEVHGIGDEYKLGAAATRKKRDIPATAQPEPDTLVATLEIADANALLGALGQSLGQVHPAAAVILSPALLDQALAIVVGAPRLAGIDYSKPVRALLLDPMTRVVVVGVADEQALRQAAGSALEVFVHEGLAVIGPEQALDSAAAYAVTTLAKKQPPKKPTATLYVKKYLGNHMAEITAIMPMVKAQISQNMPPAEAASAIALIDGTLDFFNQLDRLVASLDVGAADLTFDLQAVPTAGGTIATFLGKQKPATFSQLYAVEPGAFVFAGRLDWKGIYEKLMSFAGQAYATAYGDQMKAVMEMQKAMAEVMGEEFAMTGSFTAADGMKLAGLWEITNAAKANKILSKHLKKMPKKIGGKGVQMTMKYRRNAMRHRGVAVAETLMKLDKNTSPEVRAGMDKIFGKGGMRVLFAVFGKTSAMTMGKDARARMKTLIDVVKKRKKAIAPGPGLTNALNDAKQRNENMIFTVDLPVVAALAQGVPAPAGPMGDPVVFALGMSPNALGLRLTVPVAQVKAVIPAIGP